MRFYSLVGLPGADRARGVYRIAVKRAEPSRGGSRHLWSLEAGAELLVGEPNNHFELPLGAAQYLLVAGGIGITPIVGMALMLARRGAAPNSRSPTCCTPRSASACRPSPTTPASA